MLANIAITYTKIADRRQAPLIHRIERKAKSANTKANAQEKSARTAFLNPSGSHDISCFMPASLAMQYGAAEQR
jgi:hypothetical protein